MKPFDLEAAKRGEPVCTSDGELYRFVAHVPEAIWEERLIFVDRFGIIRVRCEDGTFNGSSANKLFMAPKKRTVWVNIYPIFTAGPFVTEEYADCKHQEMYGHWEHYQRLGGKAHSIEIEE